MILNCSTTIKALLASFGLLAAVTVSASDTASAPDFKKYVPTFHGTMKAFYQLSTVNGDSRFMVRHARLSAGGFVMPGLDYLLQVDFCDRGKIKLLDAFIRVSPVDGLSIYAGQMRVPFSVESSRAPHLYYFTNVGLVATYGNLRSVGVKSGYSLPGTGLYIEGGVFNATDMIDHVRWNSALTYGVKANYTVAGLKPEVGFMSRIPGGRGNGCRINQVDASLSWRYGGFYVEGEYIHRYYCGLVRASQAYSVFADYGWPVKWRWANRMSVQARYDGITAGSNGRYIDGKLPVDIEARKRLTFGTTTSLAYEKLHFDVKLNYEQYFYDIRYIGADDNSKLVAGAILYF